MSLTVMVEPSRLRRSSHFRAHGRDRAIDIGLGDTSFSGSRGAVAGTCIPFVDATNFVVMRSRKMWDVLAFDGDFTAAGIADVRDARAAALKEKALQAKLIVKRRDAAEAAERHLAASLPHVAGDYMGEHWLATFAVHALSRSAGASGLA